MRTTLDLPDNLMRELKARSAMEGVKLKDYFAQIAQAALRKPVAAAQASVRSPVPVFKRSGAKAMPAMSNAELNAILDSKESL
jgi:hypothetical protein